MYNLIKDYTWKVSKNYFKIKQCTLKNQEEIINKISITVVKIINILNWVIQKQME